ncbi:group II intron reverse transcriptase/maturase [Piscinibacter gummiphilus]|uniref:Group II intron reverse transcriptase/maturase n=1 Tax=Piscinibacter gummiphilus TaxID=946333 RepID=A0ABZ0CTJ8_9BURK|nr:group II intron reverse transcriptase/maturase [Piscinibacter gummiphilus]WOB06252.1 group II intron reverse transcriptase/maturase [Piscinibacter gummiphilus]
MEAIIDPDDSASSHLPAEWHAIDWHRADQQVRAMQIRIAKATKECDWRRVKALQRSLTRSFSARALAVRRVTENQGKRTAGVDRELWDTPTRKWEAVSALKQQRGYRPAPLRRVFIPKSNGKERPLGIPTMKDRAMQALHLLSLEPVVESQSDPNSYGFRRNRSTADAMSQLFVCLSQKAAAPWVLEADIEGCFDHINHEWLVSHVLADKVIVNKWLKAGVVYKGQLTSTDAGTPQGGIISPTLANLALNGLETGLVAHLVATVGKSKVQKLKVNVVRYADDFVITGMSQDILESVVKPWVETFLAQRGLRLSVAKTRVTHIDEGFDFLGWNFRKYSGTLLIKPSKKNVQAFYSKVKGIVKANAMVKQVDLIQLLNPVLRGWAQYHHPVVAKETFRRLDSLLWWRLTRWARRRHPKKSPRWVTEKYWSRIEGRSEFAARIRSDEGEARWARLYRLADTEIVRHRKVMGGYNPFDPEWEAYGEDLRAKRLLKSMAYRKQWATLFLSQHGACVRCGEAITEETGWHDHHLIAQVKGGSNALSNRVLLHPVCHVQLHALGLTVAKPASD